MQEERFSWAEIRKGIDWPMLLGTLLLFAIGLLALYSAGYGVKKVASNYVYKQALWGLISASAYSLVIVMGYRRFIHYGYWFYGFTVTALLMIDIAGAIALGAQRWFTIGGISFQPSEMGKIALILALSRFCHRYPPHNLKNMLSALALAGASMVLVLIQPDLGSTIVFTAIVFSILIVAGSPGKYLAALVSIGLAMIPFAWSVLKPYQRNRLLVFLDPTVDPRGAGYNVIQSRIAVGSGGLFGKGFLRGTQGRLHFLPEPHTDFIYSVFGEEFGFIGGIIVIALFIFLFWRILSTAFYSKDLRAKYICVGVAAWLWFQVMESIAMSIGVAPVTGLPLPLFSYGGSSLLMESVALGLVQSVSVAQSRERIGLEPLWGD